jgi:hypothetical protein
MKRSELTTGMRVGVRRGTDWVERGVDEAYVLDVDALYDYPRYSRPGFEGHVFNDPRTPGATLTSALREVPSYDRSGKVAVLKRNPMPGNMGTWRVEPVALATIVGTYEETKALCDEYLARIHADAVARNDVKTRRLAEFEKLKADFPAVTTYKVQYSADSGNVTLPLNILRLLLEGALQ